ncbi:MAG: DNA repair protein RecN [Gemmatimonadota bacterium]|nr:DNA repair protein RecN [Gemmatimonadota bacterium]
MLAELRIRNVAIIESVTVPFTPGLNVLSGETGAGKSIIIGALGLLGGGRGSVDDVRTGADRATVEGEFDVGDDADVLAALDAHGIEAEGGVVTLKREVAATGRSRAWVNGTSVTATVLADVGRTLFTIHGQHDARSLLDEESQRQMLDRYAGAIAEAAAAADAHAALEEARAALGRRVARRDDAAKRADYLRHVADEVEKARLVPGEEEALASESARLTHAEELKALTAELAAALDDGDEAVVPRLGHLQRALAALQRIDPSTETLQGAYDAAYYAMEEFSRQVAAYAETVEHDPARLAEVEQRRDLLFRLLKKYGGTVERALATGREARAELDGLDTASHDIGALEAAVREAEGRFAAAARALTARRTRGAAALSSAVEAQLPGLGMTGGRFAVRLVPRESPGATGAEDVEYRVALNVGHDDRPLARVASGGELARVMLALQVILAELERVPTLVFDEVDSGIGGAVALMVGDALRTVGARRQVFAITHLAQIGSRAAHHVAVRKGARGGVTSADVTVLDGDERVEELARMLGGDPASDVSRAHARELLGAAGPPGRRRARVG